MAFGCINTLEWMVCKHGFSHLSNFVPESNYNKLVCITLIDFFYHFLRSTLYNQTGHLFTFYKQYRDTVSYRDIFGSDMYY